MRVFGNQHTGVVSSFPIDQICVSARAQDSRKFHLALCRISVQFKTFNLIISSIALKYLPAFLDKTELVKYKKTRNSPLGSVDFKLIGLNPV